MEEQTFTIKLADDTLISCKQNGNNYIADGGLDQDLFSEDNLYGVTINGEKHEQMVLVGWSEVHDGPTNETWFVLRDMTQEELRELDINAKLDYLAMEMGVEL